MTFEPLTRMARWLHRQRWLDQDGEPTPLGEAMLEERHHGDVDDDDEDQREERTA